MKRLVIFILLLGLTLGFIFAFFILSIQAVEENPVFAQVDFDLDIIDETSLDRDFETLNIKTQAQNVLVNTADLGKIRVSSTQALEGIVQSGKALNLDLQADEYRQEDYVLVEIPQEDQVTRINIEAQDAKVYIDGFQIDNLEAQTKNTDLKISRTDIEDSEFKLETSKFFWGGGFSEDFDLDLRGGKAYVDVADMEKVDVSSVLGEVDFHATSIHGRSKFYSNIGFMYVSVHQDRDDYGLEVEETNSVVEIRGPDQEDYTYRYLMDVIAEDSRILLRFNDKRKK